MSASRPAPAASVPAVAARESTVSRSASRIAAVVNADMQPPCERSSRPANSRHITGIGGLRSNIGSGRPTVASQPAGREEAGQ